MYMANLEPDILFGQRPGRILHDELEALSTLLASQTS